MSVTIGLVGMPAAFFVAYAFRDELDLANHAFFLVLVLVVALASGLAASPLLAATLRYGAARGLVASLSVAVATYAAALGLGTVVSMAAEGSGSVTADQPDAPFVGLVLGCVVLVVAGAAAARRALRPQLPGQESNLRRLS